MAQKLLDIKKFGHVLVDDALICLDANMLVYKNMVRIKNLPDTNKTRYAIDKGDFRDSKVDLYKLLEYDKSKVVELQETPLYVKSTFRKPHYLKVFINNEKPVFVNDNMLQSLSDDIVLYQKAGVPLNPIYVYQQGMLIGAILPEKHKFQLQDLFEAVNKKTMSNV